MNLSFEILYTSFLALFSILSNSSSAEAAMWITILKKHKYNGRSFQQGITCVNPCKFASTRAQTVVVAAASRPWLYKNNFKFRAGVALNVFFEIIITVKFEDVQCLSFSDTNWIYSINFQFVPSPYALWSFFLPYRDVIQGLELREDHRFQCF